MHELTASQTATRKNFTEQFDPPEEIKENLIYLSKNLLERLRDYMQCPIHISSGYRCPRLNKAVGGVKNSQHLTGQAVDIDFGSKKGNKSFFDKIRKSEIEFDQLLNEYDYAWIHISLRKEGNRRQVLNIS